jgi:predicted Zn-dependent protease
MKHRLAFALATLALVLPSCGGSSDPKALTDKGYAELGSGDYPAAVASFEEALAALGTDTGKPEWLRAKMGAIQARTRTDADRAAKEFLDLAAGNPGRITDKDYSVVGGRLGEAKKVDQAITVLQAGMQAYPESPHLQVLLSQLGDMAKSSGSPEALDKLKGLGYVGD